MAELKTKQNDGDILLYLEGMENEKKRVDALRLFTLFTEAIDDKASMWGDSLVGFGKYHYKSDRSTQEGDWPLVAFAPRKANISIYIMPGFSQYQDLLAKLGKHKVSKGSCLYIKKLADIDETILKELIKISVLDMKKKYCVD
ncbi:DUF1801 domain-containing protein [bacterium]|nr:DUF1801 domain-containing protein [bacterium]